MKSDIGIIGIGLMGENLSLNIESRGFSVSVLDISKEKTEKFLSGRAKGKKITGCFSYEDFISSLDKPGKIMLMVQAGKVVDEVIDSLLPHLSEGDIIIDGGNTNFHDTTRRVKFLESKGVLFVGSGVSGGEEGALLGPSLMPGGSFQAWDKIKPVFEAIAAKVDGVPCCTWIGEEGAGHFVKMVHNGIEYGDMQLICETYHIMKSILNLSPDEMQQIFEEWNKGELNSYLIEITGHILAFKDSDGLPLIDKILDKAGQKGTGKWAVISSLDMGVPLTLITESVFARVLSSMKEERTIASGLIVKPKVNIQVDKQAFVETLRKALYAAKIISYAQGYQLMKKTAEEYGWKLNFGDIAMIWRGGCIIRSAFLGKIKEAFEINPHLNNILLDPFFKDKIINSHQALRDIVVEGIKNGIPLPSFSSAVAYLDGYTSEDLPANLLQAQRDYFGAHQYERKDKPRGEFFHTNWTRPP